MNFEKFKNAVTEYLKAQYSEAKEVTVKEVIKNNGVILNGMTVMFEGVNICPTIYLEDLYERYEEGTTFNRICEEVKRIVDESRLNESFDISFLCDYEAVKDRVYCKLINTEKNKNLLKDVPNVNLLDMSVVFFCLVSNGKFGEGSVLIKNDQMKFYDITVDKLYEDAKRNTVNNLCAVIKPIEEVLFEILGEADTPESRAMQEEMTAPISDNVSPMYVLTNMRKTYGAAGLLDDELLHSFFERINCDFYILPSSIHELILVPERSAPDWTELEKMVREVNSAEVSETEFLSDFIYKYSGIAREIVRVE